MTAQIDQLVEEMRCQYRLNLSVVDERFLAMRYKRDLEITVEFQEDLPMGCIVARIGHLQGEFESAARFMLRKDNVDRLGRLHHLVWCSNTQAISLRGPLPTQYLNAQRFLEELGVFAECALELREQIQRIGRGFCQDEANNHEQASMLPLGSFV
ncbi:hypothetical protein Pan97_37410 [Bremerella volcania]|uniref:Tir chaperone protein (CesT) n=1 Tax=Bremerella volcania TaxID=2527984 RepID=A0A518CBT1_9BACT|nr:hypothetical protein Pan97_37410 [Bremerella volcania]